MSFASEIARIKRKVEDAYSACDAKGATMPTAADQKLNNLPATISTIPQTAPGSSSSNLDSYLNGNLTAIESNVTALKEFAFYGDKSILSVNLPEALQIGNSALASCGALLTVSAPNVITIGSSAFSGSQKLYSVNMPNLSQLVSYDFNGCNRLVSINFPNLTSVNYSSFGGCSALATVDLPNVQTLNNSAFYRCTSLTSLVLPKVQSIKNSVFDGCTNLTVLVLKYNGVCTLNNTNTFNDTPFASTGSGGTVYVPNAYINDYKAADNWSNLYNGGSGKLSFAAIEGSAYDT